MKKTSIPFCKDIPDTWREIPNKYLFSYCSKKVGENWKGYQLLSLTTAGVKIKDINASGGKIPDSYDNYQTVEHGDMIFCLFDLDVSAVFSGLSNLNGMITSAYDVVRPNKALVNQYYIDYWFQYVFSNRYYKIYSKNIRYTIGSDAFAAIRTPVPSLKYQEKISEYLNTKIRNIDLLIEIENKQTDSLEQYKKSLINRAVSKSVKKNTKLVDSGCKWIGMIPEHWEVKKAKFVSTIFEKGSGITKEDVIADGDTACVRYGEIYSKYDNFFKECLTRTNLDRVSSPSYFESGDILFAGTGELVEEIGKNVLYKGSERCLAGGDIIIMKHNQHPGYLNYAMNSISSQLQKSYGKAKLKVVHISASNISNVYICVPSYEEQKEISDYLDEKCAAINRLIEIKKNKIRKLEEYKKSLIYECVTGKKEVAYEI